MKTLFEGINITFFVKKYYKKIKLLGYLEGDKGSVAEKVVEFIASSEESYPYCDRYSFLGPNSNTYLQWVLNKFPEFNIKLCWRFVGKGYKVCG